MHRYRSALSYKYLEEAEMEPWTVWLVVSALIATIFTGAVRITKEYERFTELAVIALIVFTAWPLVLLLYIYIFMVFPSRGDVGRDAYVPHFYD